MGKIYKFYPAKPVFLACVTLFEVGSAICGAAPTSKAFIIGRAIAGLGASGLFSGLMVIMFHTIPLRQRPMFQGAFGAIFAVGSVVGPLVGGTFVDKVTWYVNLTRDFALCSTPSTCQIMNLCRTSRLIFLGDGASTLIFLSVRYRSWSQSCSFIFPTKSLMHKPLDGRVNYPN